jgi:D-galactonate transporter
MAHPQAAPGRVAAVEDAIYARVTRRLLPVLFLCYVTAYLDRVNVGFAKLQMLNDLGFSEATYGLGAGIFFLGYCAAEVPSNMLLARIGGRRWLARILVTWGVVSACMLFVRTPASFYALRCLLGAAEAGMFPGTIYYLTRWYPAHRRGRILSIFMAAQPVTGVIGGPLSGWIMQSMQGALGLAGWQWLFLVEALPAVAMGIVLFYCIDDRIADAHWLRPDEKHALEAALAADAARKQDLPSFASVLGNGRVWLLGAITFTSVMGLYGVGFWLPSIVRATGIQQPLRIGLLTAIPYALTIVAMLLLSRNSDRTGERRWHLAWCTTAGGIGLILSTLAGGNAVLAMLALTIATIGIGVSQPLFWNLPTAFLGGGAAAAAIALINVFGNLAGFFGPYTVGWIVKETHRTTVGMYVLAGFLFLSSILALCVPARLVNSSRWSETPRV